MSTEILYAKLQEINTQCSPERQQKKEADEQATRDKDPFNRDRKELAVKIREIREAITARDALYQKNDRVGGVKAGTHIRTQMMKEAQEIADRLEKTHKERKKLKINEFVMGASDEKKQADNARQKIIDAMKLHLRDVDKLERTIKTPGSTDLDISESSEPEHGERKVVTLPDLDNPIFDHVNENEEIITRQLGRLHEGVLIVKQDALDIRDEIDDQEPMLTQVTEHVAETLGTLKSVNSRLKETLQEVRSARNFVCDIILCLLILGIVGAIYGLLSKPHTN